MPEKPQDKSAPDKPLDKPVAETPAAENPAALAERAEQEKSYKEIDISLRRARALEVETAQTVSQIQERRRALFTRALFAQSSSLFRPGLWADVVSGLPHDARAAQTIALDWAGSAARKLEGWHAPVLGALLAMLLVFVWPLTLAGLHYAGRRALAAEHSRLHNILAANLVGGLVAALPLLALAAISALVLGFDLVTGPVRPLAIALAEGVARLAIVSGLAIALLGAPRPDWRLLPASDVNARRLLRLAISLAVIVSLNKLLSAGADVIGATLPLVVVLRGTGAFVVALVLLQALNSLAREKGASIPEGAAPQRSLLGPLRLLAWLVVAAILLAILVGYVALAVFMVDQIVWIFCVGAALFLLLALAGEGIPAVLQPQSVVGRALVTTIGLKHESLQQISILMTGAIQMVLYGVSALLVVAPWGVQSDDFAGSVRTAFFGFKVGDVTISFSNIIFAILLFGLALGVTRAIQQWLETQFLPHTQLDRGLRNSIKTSLGYFGFVFAAALALSHLGLGFDKLTIVAGALSVGIGFGLQSIVNNFVSGLILLWERAIRVGDWIVVGDEQGYVRRINVRSTEIETFERSMVIVPNSNLVSGMVKNWVRGDRIGRIKLVLNLNPSADIGRVSGIVFGTAKAQEAVIKIPAPSVLFADLTEAGARLELYCYVEDVEQAGRVRSDLLFDLHQRLTEAGLMGALASNALNPAALRALLDGLVPAQPA